jgi:hypothetical protein
MIDSQIRPLCEYSSTFRNLQKVKIPVIGLPVSPIPAFLVIVRYAGLGAGATTVYNRHLYKLPLWAARLYDSLLVFSADRWMQSTEPVNCGMPPSPLCGGGGRGLFDRFLTWWRLYGDIKPSRKSSLSTNCLWSQADGYFSDDQIPILLNRPHAMNLFPLAFGIQNVPQKSREAL